MGALAAGLGAAGNVLTSALGFIGAGRAGRDIATAAQAAEQGTLGASSGAQQAVIDQLNFANPSITGAQNNAINNVQQFGNYAQNLLGGNLNTALGNVNPYLQGGQFGVESLQGLAQNPYQVTTPAWLGANQGQPPPQFNNAPGAGPGGAAAQFNFAPTMQQLEQTPGYQFARQEGLNAIQGGNSASGLGQSSNQNLDAAKFATGLASQTYQNAFQNAAQRFGMNQNAFNQTYQNALQGFGSNINAYNSSFANNLAGTQANFGMAYQPIQELTRAGLAGSGQANQALLGFGIPAAQDLYNTGVYGGNAIQNAAQFNAQQGLQGTEFAGNIALPAAAEAGNFALQGAGANAASTLLQYGNLASGGAGALNAAGGYFGGGGFGGGGYGPPNSQGTYGPVFNYPQP